MELTPLTDWLEQCLLRYLRLCLFSVYRAGSVCDKPDQSYPFTKVKMALVSHPFYRYRMYRTNLNRAGFFQQPRFITIKLAPGLVKGFVLRQKAEALSFLHVLIKSCFFSEKVAHLGKKWIFDCAVAEINN